jgi:CTP:molybdopterin cytidylyltransferase MocA
MNRKAPDRSSAGLWAVVLAAGESQRFGGDKLTSLLAGRPLIDWSLSALGEARLAGNLNGIVAVLRSQDGGLRGLVDPLAETVVLPPDVEPSLAHSLRAGLEALQAPARQPVSAALICLADQPGLTPDTVAALVRAWRSGAGPVIRPRYAERPEEPGHPLILDRTAWSLADAAAGDAGLGPILRQQPALVHYVDLPGANPDIDQPADLDAFRSRVQ